MRESIKLPLWGGIHEFLSESKRKLEQFPAWIRRAVREANIHAGRSRAGHVFLTGVSGRWKEMKSERCPGFRSEEELTWFFKRIGRAAPQTRSLPSQSALIGLQQSAVTGAAPLTSLIRVPAREHLLPSISEYMDQSRVKHTALREDGRTHCSRSNG